MAKLANRFTHPMAFYGVYKTNSWAGYYFKEALGYTSGVHTGVDYNGIGGGNSDLGMPLVAIANGIVVAVENKTTIGFGWTTIIQHRLSKTLREQLGVSSLFSRTMHQRNVSVVVGQEVSIGQQIAEVGNSGTTYAHVHLDLYKDTIDGGGIHWRYDKDTQLASYLDPYTYIDAHQNPVDSESELLPYQRIVSNPTGVNHRTEPNTSATIIREWTFGEILDFAGYVEGESVSGNNIWFKGRYSGGYLWSGSFQGGKDTTGLENLTPVTPPTPEPEPPYAFIKDLESVTQVTPAANGNFEKGNFPLAPTTVVIHDFGSEGLDTFESTLNEFTKKGTEKSAHFVVSGKRRAQVVSLSDRGYHAGPAGNNYIGIETDPKQDSDTIASTRLLLEELKAKYGYQLLIIKHSSLMATQCGDDVDLQLYDITPVVPAPSGLEGRVVKLEESNTKVVNFLQKTFKEF